ncbi:MAG: midcut-by-XrtH protein [Chromatiales bacterium]|nr:midcut-by-XrtH protein [Chromatiales bacterium]
MSSRVSIRRIAAILPAGAFSADVLAQANGGAGMIIYEPFARQVPTFGGFALVALALLLATVAFRLVRRPSGDGSRFLTLAIAATAIAAGGSGVKLIGDARAAVAIQLLSSSGGIANIPDFENCHLVNNGTPVAQQITQLLATPPWILSPCPSNGGGFYETCNDSPGTVLNPGQTCEIYANDPVPDV